MHSRVYSGVNVCRAKVPVHPARRAKPRMSTDHMSPPACGLCTKGLPRSAPNSQRRMTRTKPQIGVFDHGDPVELRAECAKSKPACFVSLPIAIWSCTLVYRAH